MDFLSILCRFSVDFASICVDSLSILRRFASILRRFRTADGLLISEGFSNLRKRLEIRHPRWSVWSRCLQVAVHFGGFSVLVFWGSFGLHFRGHFAGGHNCI